jgi:prepilin-type N-terminal cleavage/methylation domain-containing protein/prepilin-type processing-associated H-X9-DG protein
LGSAERPTTGISFLSVLAVFFAADRVFCLSCSVGTFQDLSPSSVAVPLGAMRDFASQPSGVSAMFEKRRRGLTMIELMVVVAIIALLLGLLLVGIQKVRGTAVMMQCSNNMANLGFAYRNYKSGTIKPLVGKDANAQNALVVQWVSSLSRYVDNAQITFKCPMDDGSGSTVVTPAGPAIVLGGAGDVASGSTTVLAGSTSWVPGATMYIALWNQNHTTPIKIYDLGGSNIIAIQKNGLRSRQSSAYPDPGNGGWYAEFETTYGTSDDNSALDWNDLYLLIQPQPNGTNQVTFYASDGGAKTANTVGGDETFDLLDGNQNLIASNIQLGQSGYIPIVSGLNGLNASSYGMNSEGDYLNFESTKILLLEYKNTIARVVAPANADISQYSANVASRHNGALNVLYADGHIEAKTAGDIDPNIPTYQASYWAP